MTDASDATVEAVDGGFAVKLDGRGVKTPAKTPLVVPTEALAEAIAQEWRDQEEKVDPTKMPFTTTSNSALDKVTLQHAEDIRRFEASYFQKQPWLAA